MTLIRENCDRFSDLKVEFNDILGRMEKCEQMVEVNIKTNYETRRDLNKCIKDNTAKIFVNSDVIQRQINFVDRLAAAITNVKAALDLDLSLMLQDDIDKQRTELYGVEELAGTPEGDNFDAPIKINQNCMSCSGASSYIKKAFKLACLNYRESEVHHLSQSFKRRDLYAIKAQLLEQMGVLKRQDNERGFDASNSLRASTVLLENGSDTK